MPVGAENEGKRKGKLKTENGRNAVKILLVAINAKYIHANPAVRSLRASAGRAKDCVEIVEFTINELRERILGEIYRRRPDVTAFSCYIWNREYVVPLVRDLHLLRPEMPIWAGGPEVSFDTEEFLRECPEVTGVLRGEGEISFARLAEMYVFVPAEDRREAINKVPGITWRGSDGKIHENPPAPPADLDSLPFFYAEEEPEENRIIYYESSRGCPFSCSYCLSSVDRGVRFRSLSLVLPELQYFLDKKVQQVKFVDRTFNCRHDHALAIWRYIAEHDNGVTNFHFEIGADLLNEEELAVLSAMRPGLVQLEIGVQSANAATIAEVSRTMDLDVLCDRVKRIKAGHNIHQHLDLIAGLPLEDAESFRKSFNAVYALEPEELQLGFLKALRGSELRRKASSYGIRYKAEAPYEVLMSSWMSYDDILHLKEVEEMLEVYYNSFQFTRTIKRLLRAFPDAFSLYEGLAAFYGREGLWGKNHSRQERFALLRQFARESDPEHSGLYDELLLFDLYARENAKSRPAWAPSGDAYKEIFREFYRLEAEKREYLQDYPEYDARQLSRMTHMEAFSAAAMEECLPGEETAGRKWTAVLFDYRKRDPLTGDAGIRAVRSLDLDGKRLAVVENPSRIC